MCGIVAISGYDDIITSLSKSLKNLSHRGGEASGIVTYESGFHLEKKIENIDTFLKRDLSHLVGSVGIGHVRYSTSGGFSLESVQPQYKTFPFPIAMAYNGNITNINHLFKILKIEPIKNYDEITILLNILSLHLSKYKTLTPENVFKAIGNFQKDVKGGYSVVAILGHYGVVAFKDKNGIRPLIMGKKTVLNNKNSYIFSSESISLKKLDFEIIRELEPGEIIYIDCNKNVYQKNLEKNLKNRFCLFEYIYFSSSESIINNISVKDIRLKIGYNLAEQVKKLNIKADYVIDIPKSGYYGAIGVSKCLNIPYKSVLKRVEKIGRSFILPTQKDRKKIISEKFIFNLDNLKGKNIIVVDDSIVRGNTIKYITKKLKSGGVNKIYLLSTAPPVKHQCIYGIDISSKKELIANSKTLKEMELYLGIDKIIFQNLDSIKTLFENYTLCDACFSGNYPTKIDQDILESIELNRVSIKNLHFKN